MTLTKAQRVAAQPGRDRSGAPAGGEELREGEDGPRREPGAWDQRGDPGALAEGVRGLTEAEAARLKNLRTENKKLRRAVTNLAIEKVMFEEVR